jgi:hypothetical protein
VAGDPGAWPRLEPALTRPIRWDLIAAQYDSMIKYATAIRTGTASTEAILRRFTKANAVHPAYQAIAEVGRAQRTIFIARYLRDRDLQREIGEGLNVVESWNRANAVIFFGKGGDIATNRRDEQELSALCLRILQAALVYVDTLMVQDVLADQTWADRLTPEDRRGLTPLFWAHVAPYGEVRLDMGRRLSVISPSDQPDHARLGRVTRFLPAPHLEEEVVAVAPGTHVRLAQPAIELRAPSRGDPVDQPVRLDRLRLALGLDQAVPGEAVLPNLSNSPSRAPPRNASHSSRVNLRTDPAGSRLLRTPTEPPGSSATSTQLPLEKLRELLTQIAFICLLLVTRMRSARTRLPELWPCRLPRRYWRRMICGVHE